MLSNTAPSACVAVSVPPGHAVTMLRCLPNNRIRAIKESKKKKAKIFFLNHFTAHTRLRQDFV